MLAFAQVSHIGYCLLPQILCSKAVLRRAAYNLLLCEAHSNYISSLPLKKAWLLRSPTAQSCESQMRILIVGNGLLSSARSDCPLGLHPLPSPLPSPGGPRSRSLLCLFLQGPLPLCHKVHKSIYYILQALCSTFQKRHHQAVGTFMYKTDYL